MSSVVISGDTSGSVTLTVPAVAGSNTVTIPAGTGTVAVQGVSTNIVSGTAVASTSGTAILFTGIPSWVKRITVLFSGVSFSGSAGFLVQIGSGSVTTSGYLSYTGQGYSGGASSSSSTTGFGAGQGSNDTASTNRYGTIVIYNLAANTWVSAVTYGSSSNPNGVTGGGAVALSGVLDRVNVTTTNGTDTFDAGTINITWE